MLGLFLSLFTLVACQEETVILEKEDLEALVFENATFEYDGNTHNIYVQDVPKGVTVTYMSKDLVNPGTYIIIAIVECNGVKVTKHATLTINQKASVLEAETVQTTYLYGGNPFPTYKLNNDEQELI